MIEVKAQYCPQNHPCPVVGACPAQAVDQDGFSAPKVDEEKCVDCNLCIGFCPAFSRKD